jgi:hypothetical protein
MPIIPNAKSYSVDGLLRVFREGHPVRARHSETGVFARLRCDDGVTRRVNIAKVGRAVVTREFIFAQQNARTHPDFPDYAVTAYGDLYCTRPPKAGRHANECYSVPDFFHGRSGKRHVSIRRPDGRRYIVRLAKLVQEVWGSKSRFSQDE